MGDIARRARRHRGKAAPGKLSGRIAKGAFFVLMTARQFSVGICPGESPLRRAAGAGRDRAHAPLTINRIWGYVEGMLIDIFTYSAATPGGAFELGELIGAARAAQLDAIAVTDRAASAHARAYAEAGRRAGFPVFVGLELETQIGRVTVYPAHIDDEFASESWRELGECPSAEAVLDYFHARGAAVAARDAYDGDGGMKDRVYSVKDSRGRGFDCIDTLSARRRKIDNELCIEAQKVMGVGGCAGSGVLDDLSDIGCCATLFADAITDQASFAAALRGALHWAAALRDLGHACPMGVPPRYEEENERSCGDRRRRNDRSERGDGRRNDRPDRGERRGGHPQGRRSDHNGRRRRP